jgi:hypothetical protein
MLISKENIKKYLDNIPPIPKFALECLNALKNGDIKKAAEAAKNDSVLKKQIEKIVNSAAFALRNKVDKTLQLFTFFYLVSKPNYINLNSLIEFNPKCIKYIPKIYERINNDS